MYKINSFRFFFLSSILLLLFASIGCEVSLNKGNPPSISDEEAKKVSSKLPTPSFPDIVTDGSLADYNWSVTDLTGKTIKADGWKGKVVVLNLWATWCGPCVAEMPSFQSLYEKTKNDNVAFVFLSNEDQDTVNKFIQKRNYSLPIYTATEPLPSSFSTDAIPKTFVISPAGKIVFEHIGGANWDSQKTIDFLKSVSQLK